MVVAVLATIRRNSTVPSGEMAWTIRPTSPPYSVEKLAVGSVIVFAVACGTGGFTGFGGTEWPSRVMISPSSAT